MRLVPIPEEKYESYRLKLMFDCFKWDPQFLDHNTIAKYALVITEKEYEELKQLTEELDRETRAAEMFLNQHLELSKPLLLTKKCRKHMPRMKNYDGDKHVRLMRYDFHPIIDGKWAVSEVNSDVPGGFAEGSLMPQAAIVALDTGNYGYINFGNRLIDAIAKKTPAGGRIAMVHCTCYSDDRQVMQFLGEQLENRGFSVVYMAADHLKFENGKAISLLDGNEGPVDAIVRFTPLEWLSGMKTKHWDGYFDTTTTSCNHPIAIFAQSKRFPFVWDMLEKHGIQMSTWRELLPDTIEVKEAKARYIYKPVYGRVGENISIKESCTDEEYKRIMREVKLFPKTYIAQERFKSKPLEGVDGKEYHVCIGSYTVDTKHAGFYARISDTPRIDSGAEDIPVLIEREENTTLMDKLDVYDEHNLDRGIDSYLKQDIIRRRLTGKEIYQIWAPYGKKWVDWVRPVPFIEIHTQKKGYVISQVSVPEQIAIETADGKAAIIVDLPGTDSIEMGLVLAKKGYRPIPIFNGVEEQRGARATTDNQSIDIALFYGAKILEQISIPEDAPPAFLLDSNRLQRYKIDDSIFDNSWDIYPQDIPSAKYFFSEGIEKIIVIGDGISRDLKKILRDFKKKGLHIYLSDGYQSFRN